MWPRGATSRGVRRRRVSSTLRLAAARDTDSVSLHAPMPKEGQAHRALLAVEFPGLDDFDDPKLEFRRLFSELFGTFLLVLVGAGAGVVDAKSHGAISRSAAVAAPGLMVMTIIFFMGAVSGAHLNPAVTLAFSLRKNFPWRRVPGYLLAQLAQATKALTDRPDRTSNQHNGQVNALRIALEEHDGNSDYHEGQVDALTVALEEHDRLFRAGQPA